LYAFQQDLLAARKTELRDVDSALDSLLKWKPNATLEEIHKIKSAKERASTGAVGDNACAYGQNDDDKAEEEDHDYFSDDDEQDEPAPQQPEPPQNPADAGEEELVFDIANQAMEVLRKEDEDVKNSNSKSDAKPKMSLLDRCFFDVRKYISRLVASMPSKDDSIDERHQSLRNVQPTNIIAGGSTQMGKTMFVTIGYLAAWFAECPLVCITTTVSGTKSLHAKVLESVEKMQHFGADDMSQFCIYQSAMTVGQTKYFGDSVNKKDFHFARAGLGGHQRHPDKGVLFIADTAAQMSKAIKHITSVRQDKVGSGVFGLLVDEADSMQRSSDDRLLLEKRLKDLKGEGEGFKDPEGNLFGAQNAFQRPCLILSISATLLPVLLKMYKTASEQGTSKTIETFFTKAPPSKYVGVLSEV